MDQPTAETAEETQQDQRPPLAHTGTAAPAGQQAADRGPAQGRRWAIGVLALAAAPLAWYAATRPLAPAAAPGASGTVGEGAAGTAAKGVGPLVDHQAPDFTLRDPGGKPIGLKQFRGQPVLLNFWATWCTPCKEEMPEFEQVYRQHKDQGLVVLAVSIDAEASANDVPAYLKEGSPRVGSYTFPVALDTKQEVALTYKLVGLPATFFIDKAGVIRALQPGAMNRQLILDKLKTILPNPA
jgi:peroxiredoxin